MISADRGLRPAHLAFVCFASTTLVFSPNTSIFRGFSHNAFIGYFIFSMFLVALAVSGSVAFMSRRSGASPSLSRPMRFIYATLYAISSLVFMWLSAYPMPSIAVPIVAGSVCGLTLVFVCLMWVELFGGLGFQSGILLSSLLCIGTCLLGILFSLVPNQVDCMLFSIGTVLGAFTPVSINEPEMDGSMGGPADSNQPEVPRSDSIPSTSDLVSTLRLPVIGLVLYAFMMSIYKVQPFGGLDIEFVCGLVASVLILPLFAVSPDKPLSSLIYRVIAPIIGGVVIVVASFPSTSLVHGASIFATYTFLSALGILALAGILAIMGAGEFPKPFITSVALAVGCIASLLGLVWTKLLGGPTDPQPVITVLATVYCAVMLVSLGLETWRLVNSTGKDVREQFEVTEAEAPDAAYCDDGAPEDPPYVVGEGARGPGVADLLERAGLTKREREILTYWGRGHSVIYIADKLFISESTVRAHVKHIYAKLDIHSREELFELLDRS